MAVGMRMLMSNVGEIAKQRTTVLVLSPAVVARVAPARSLPTPAVTRKHPLARPAHVVVVARVFVSVSGRLPRR